MTLYIVLINRFFIAWRLQSQKTVILSVIEAEYSPIMEVFCEIIFVCVILLFMWFFIEYPINVDIDKIITIFLPENTLVSQRTKHIDVRHNFFLDCVEDGTVKIQFFCSEENLADPFTKNLSNGPFESLT